MFKQKILVGFNDLSTTHPEVASEWNYDLNDITPNEVTAGSHQKVWWKGSWGHSWDDSTAHRTRGRGCPKCGQAKSKAAKDMMAKEYAEKYEGETLMMNCGKKATIIKYRTSHDIDVKFEDGTMVEHRSYHRFKTGSIGYPNRKIKNTGRT
jgi:hypothetical protein